MELTYRYQGAVPALLGRRSSSFPGLRASSSSRCSSASSPLAALLPAARRRRCCLRLPVLVGALGLGLQTALVQGERLLPLQLQALQRRVLVAALAAVVMLPEELDPPPESLHHRAASRCNKIRHHQSRLAGEKIPPRVSVAAVRFVHKMRLNAALSKTPRPSLFCYKDPGAAAAAAGSMEATFVLLMAFSRSGTHWRRGKLRVCFLRYGGA